MLRLAVSGILTLFLCAVVLWLGGSEERRYENYECNQRMIYDYKPVGEMGLLTLGGSRIRVATATPDFDLFMDEEDMSSGLVHNLGHTNYSLGQEYVFLRDALEKHSPRSVLVMVEPRMAKFGTVEQGFIETARLSDIPLAMRTAWVEEPRVAISVVRDIFVKHLYVMRPIKNLMKKYLRISNSSLAKRYPNPRNCDTGDHRLSVQKLANAEQKYNEVSKQILEWDLSSGSEVGFLRWMKAYKLLADSRNVGIIFLLMTGTDEPLPQEGFSKKFEDVTGMPIITLTSELHEIISRNGKRDNIHLNSLGRKEFIPWLIDQIKEKCRLEVKCI